MQLTKIKISQHVSGIIREGKTPLLDLVTHKMIPLAVLFFSFKKSGDIIKPPPSQNSQSVVMAKGASEIHWKQVSSP
jgi:hypothetical protein